MEVEMKIRGLMMDPVTNMPIVVLKDTNGSAVLPIWVGVYEANAIALEIEKVQTPRPMTHDLLKNVLLGLNVQVQKVVVTDLREDTFYALIWVERDGERMSIDSRPSDALALALRVDCPIFVDEMVLKSSKSLGAINEKSTSEELRKWLEGFPTTTSAAIRCSWTSPPSLVRLNLLPPTPLLSRDNFRPILFLLALAPSGRVDWAHPLGFERTAHHHFSEWVAGRGALVRRQAAGIL